MAKKKDIDVGNYNTLNFEFLKFAKIMHSPKTF
jgi:hypothetical protein